MLRGVTEVVRSRQVGRVAVMELHRPQVRHAMDTHLLDELIEALRSAARAGDTDAVVVTGSGGCFSSGADVSEDIDRAAAQVTRHKVGRGARDRRGRGRESQHRSSRLPWR